MENFQLLIDEEGGVNGGRRRSTVIGDMLVYFRDHFLEVRGGMERKDGGGGSVEEG